MNIVKFINEKLASDDSYILFPKGEHNINSKRLKEDFRFVSNNDDSLKRLFCDVNEKENFIIDGNGSDLLFTGRLIPFYFRKCRNITLRNFSIDWPRPFLSQAEVTASGKGWVEFKFSPEYPVELKNNKLFFYGPDYNSEGFLFNFLEFDKNLKEPRFKVKDNHQCAKNYSAVELGKRRFRLNAKMGTIPLPGNIIVFKHELRLSPAIVIENCKNITLENINIFHCGGMGVIAQGCRDVYLKLVNIIPKGKRYFSTHADATHFVDCEGDIFIDSCRFENQLDDPVNIHGIFRRVSKKISSKKLEIKLMHHQHLGVESIKEQDWLGFYDSRTLQFFSKAQVAKVKHINSQVSELDFAIDFPELDWGNVAVMRSTQDINVKIAGCSMKRNRARGPLISTLGKVLIENNYFHVPGAAIRISGDANNWYEAGPVESVEIRHNIFDNCNYGIWGKGLVDITPELSPEFRQFTFHRNINIHHNKIKYFQMPFIHAFCAEDLRFKDNTLIKTNDYPKSDVCTKIKEIN
jgi:hypothetical protein